MKREVGDLLFYSDTKWRDQDCYLFILERTEEHYLVYTWNPEYVKRPSFFHRVTYKESPSCVEGQYCTKVN